MRGSTRKRNSTWTAYWDGLDATTGQRRQKSRGGFRTQKEAQAHLATVISSAGGYLEPSKQPLARFLRDEWLPATRARVRPLSFTSYEYAVQKVTEHDIGAVPLRGLSGAQLTAFYGELEAEGLSVSTRRLVHSACRRALNDAVRWGKLIRNPTAAADPPALPRPHIESWSARELARFLAHVEHDRLAALWRLAATSGMRRGELLGLTWRALDLDGARLRVEQQLLCTVGGVRFGPPKSPRSERTIALDPGTVEALRSHCDTQCLERDLASSAYEDGDLVFANELGRPIHPHGLTDQFRRHRKAAGLPSGSLHVLRHTATTLALTAGVPLHVVAARMGDDPRTILATYAHLLPHSDEMAAEAVAAALADKPLTNPATREPQTA